jgi:hypothetical protein
MRRRTFQRLHAAYLAAVQMDEVWIQYKLAQFEAKMANKISATSSSLPRSKRA